MKLTTYQNPLSGKESKLTNVGNLWSLFLGSVVVFFIFIFGMRTANFFVDPIDKATGVEDTTAQRIIF